MSRASRNPALRVAIVGLGPKGLFALERLADACVAGAGSIEVEIFEPHPVAGAGPVYDPSQPDYLRMNFAASQVNAWPEASQAVPAAEQLSFEAWRHHQPAGRNDDYPPRTQVGLYLSDCLARVMRHADFPLTTHRAAVTSIERSTSGWRVGFDGSHADFDEVLLATGHAGDWIGALRHSWEHAAALVDAVFPVESKLTTAAIPPGASVAARGYALTFIDLALALTEGRGGSFEPMGGARLRYVAAGLEPAAILPFSRTGLPMLAKPAPAPTTAACDAAVTAARAALLEAPADPAELSAAVDRLASDLALEETDADLARGAAWRALYPAIVRHFGGDGLPASEWPAFRALAADMERVAFGPPPVNAAKLAALIDAGLFDPRHARGAVLETAAGSTRLRSHAGQTPIDVVVDAVLAPPGVAGIIDPLLEQLLRAEHVRVPPGRRGIEVAADAGCVDSSSSPTPGLAACGRVTEDSVIGNDTLSRTLHPQLDNWAARIVRRTRKPLALAS